MIAFLVGCWQTAQVAHVTSSRCVAGQIAIQFPAGVAKGLDVPFGRMTTTGAIPRANN